MTLEEKDIQKADETKFAEAIKLRDQGKFSDALVLVEQLIPKYPNNPALLATAAFLNWELGSLDKAASIFMSATELSPKSETVSLGLFHCLWDMGRHVEALNEAKRFMSVSYSKEYVEIIMEINLKSDKNK